MFYKQSEKVKIKKIGSTTALYISEQKCIHVLNETALFIWEALQDPFTFDEILYMLGETFEADSKQLKEDLQEILDSFLQHNLVSTKT